MKIPIRNGLVVSFLKFASFSSHVFNSCMNKIGANKEIATSLFPLFIALDTNESITKTNVPVESRLIRISDSSYQDNF